MCGLYTGVEGLIYLHPDIKRCEEFSQIKMLNMKSKNKAYFIYFNFEHKVVQEVCLVFAQVKAKHSDLREFSTPFIF